MSNNKHLGLKRRNSGMMALEQRFMFDGAAVDTLHDQLVDLSVADVSTVVVADVFKFDASTASLAGTAQLAQQQVRDYLAGATDAQLFDIFNGGKTAPDAAWTERLASLREAFANGSFNVNVVAMDSASQFTAVAAFAESGPDGQPTIFINTYWFGMFDAPDATRTLVEEVGHAFDAYLNPNADSAGDEGESFADMVIDGSVSQEQSSALLTQNDHGQVVVNGVSYEVEFASFNFVNAYHMVYDWDTQNNREDTTERWASKEQNLHYFNTAGLGAVSISDGSNGTNFSGNDVSAVALTIGGQTYNGWISRPIKSNGIVRGFYFWTDVNFTSLALAQADGNQDSAVGDPGNSDNRGFVLVVDQTWFNQQIADTDFTKEFTSTSKDVLDGYVTSGSTLTVASVGSSSDRVDSALNSVVSSNTAPSAVNDVASGTPSTTPSTGQGNAALEQGYNTNTSTVITATIDGSGNVLANDTDSNSDSLSVTTISSKLTGASGTASSGGTQIVGKYGTLTMQSDGDWTYEVNNSSATINALLSGNTQEDFTYTASDGKGGTSTATLTVQINGSNDAPVASNDYNSAKETLTDGAGTTTYTGYSATGDVLPNDTDVDSGDNKSIVGSSTSGTGSGTTRSSSSTSSTVLSFDSVSSSIKVGHYVFWDGLQTQNNNSGTDTVNLKTSGGTNITVQSIDYVNKTVTLSGLVSNKTLSAGTVLGFSNQANGNANYKDASISGSASQTTSIVDLSTYTGTIAIGMTVTGGGLPDGTKVTNVGFDSNGNPTSVTISSTTTLTSASLTFSGSGSAGQTIAGKYGTLVLNANGSYTYTPYADNAAIDNGDAVLETFTYTMQDTAGSGHVLNFV